MAQFTQFFRELQHKGYRFQNEVNDLWHQGFEWEGSVEEVRVEEWTNLTYSIEEVQVLVKSPKAVVNPNQIRGVKNGFQTIIEGT